jgi:hypothetical protein
VPLSDSSKRTISLSRAQIASILRGESDKIVVVVGPCSIHDPEEAKEYAALLKEEAKNLKNLVIVMRAYFEKVSLLLALFRLEKVAGTSEKGNGTDGIPRIPRFQKAGLRTTSRL